MHTAYSPINFADRLARINEHWSPRVIAELNDYQFKLVKLQGDFVWHSHADTDEAFVVVEGAMSIEFRDGQVDLSAGEMFVVPRGKEHKPHARDECKVLLIEPRGVVNTGDAAARDADGASALTAPNNVWA
jgi:mannose-6-phosphate isomerase-like protein (cupin superfamily)